MAHQSFNTRKCQGQLSICKHELTEKWHMHTQTHVHTVSWNCLLYTVHIEFELRMYVHTLRQGPTVGGCSHAWFVLSLIDSSA